MTHPIPSAALDNHIAILGKTGSGKSNAAKTIVERLLNAGERVCAIDPTGTWWGLRLTADGKHPSPWPIVIFGGDRGDLPLGAEHGAAIAETIATSSTPAILDVRTMTVGERTRFFGAFAEALVRKMTGTLTLVIDEAHLFMPQATYGGGKDVRRNVMLEAANNLVSLGRGVGLRIIMVSQRPAKLHKDSLTQVETLVAMRLIAPQDTKAIKEWVKEWADTAKGDEIVSTLPSLSAGHAWVWAPELDVLRKVAFPLVSTFDSGKPRPGRRTPDLRPIDVASLTAKLKSVAADALANDPKALKAEIAKLRAELQKTRQNITQNIPADPEALAKAEQRGFEQAERKLKDAMQRELGRKLKEALGVMRKHAESVVERVKDELREIDAKDVCIEASYAVAPAPPVPTTARAGMPIVRPVKTSSVPLDGFLTRPQLKVLRALAIWRSLGHDAPSREMVAAVAGYSPSSGGYNNLIGSLGPKAKGAIGIPQPGRLTLEAAGIDVPGIDEGRELLLSVLSNPQRKLVAALNGAGTLSRDQLGQATGYSASSGGFNNLVGSLNTIGLSYVPAQGHVALSDWAQQLLDGHEIRIAA